MKVKAVVVAILIGFSVGQVSADNLTQGVATSTIKKAGDITESLRVVTKQEVVNTQQLSQQMIKNERESLAIRQGIKQSDKYLEARKEYGPGTGLSQSHLCLSLEEQKTAVIRRDFAKKATATDLATASNSSRKHHSERLRERHSRHQQLYCDASEAARGQCLLSPNGRGGADSNFGTIGKSARMDEADREAAKDYINNISNVAVSEYSDCGTELCKTLNMHERRYQALSNTVHEAFLNQMNMKTVNDTPKRLAKLDLLVQDEGEIVGEFDGVTVHPETGAVTLGGDPTSTSTKATLEAKQTTVANAIIIGDSIAEEYRASDIAIRGSNPAKVLEFISKAGDLKDKVVILSTGLSNNYNDKNSVIKQLQALKDAGAYVTVLGVATNFMGEPSDDTTTRGVELNGFLREQASLFGFAYQEVGKYKSGDTYKVHPDKLKIFKDATRLSMKNNTGNNNSEQPSDGNQPPAESKDNKGTQLTTLLRMTKVNLDKWV